MRTQAEIRDKFAPSEELAGHKVFFLVGIGGAGMSGLAKMLHSRGFEVKGSDSTPSAVTAELQVLGINVHVGHTGSGIKANMAVILTDAIDLENSAEVACARSLGCKIFRRSQLLGWLITEYRVIAVTGTHGKTTTTGMLGAGLRAAGQDPLIIVGASVPEFGSSIVEGKGLFAVVEACEAYDSFHDLKPAAVLLTNLELDHVDFHGTFEALSESVLKFVQSLPKGGPLVYCEDDPGAAAIASHYDGLKIPYTLRPNASSLPGDHNSLNASGTLAIAKALGFETSDFVSGVFAFAGAERRLQTIYDESIKIIDDYAHHPTEVEASLRALRSQHPDRRLVVVFQPHLYSRTSEYIREFASSLSEADFVVLTDIYPARETPIPGVSSARIAELLTVPSLYVPSRHLLPRMVSELCRKGDVVVGMGAGNISDFGPALARELSRSGPVKVAVCYGGDSAEREVSILSGQAINDALLRKGYEAKLVDVTDELLSKGSLSGFVGPDRPDVAFLAVHGTNAEDGAIQGLLQLLHIPFTGSGIQSSSLCMDKDRCKQILEAAGIRVPVGQLLRRGHIDTSSLPCPAVVKPNAQGSTVGLSFVENTVDLQSAIEAAFQYDNAVLVEEWVRGTEISVPVLIDRALLPVEIVPISGRYDFESKYTPGATEEICPARLDTALAQESQRIALAAHRAMGCEGVSRTDMIVSEGGIVVLEINTLPGMTSTSLLPRSAAQSGMSFDDLVDAIVQDALGRYAQKA